MKFVFALYKLSNVDGSGSASYLEEDQDVYRKPAGRITTTIDRMEAGNFGDRKTVGAGVTERSLDFGPGYRIYFGRDGSKLIVLLGGGTKRRQQSDIEKAKFRWKDDKARKKKTDNGTYTHPNLK